MRESQSGLNLVTVVIVSYNSAHCLDSLANGLVTLPHIIVVDNASHDGSLEKIETILPQAHCIGLGTNIGFGRANNLALEQVKTPYALLLNPDCELVESDITKLLKAAREDWPEAAILAPQLVDQSGAVQLNYSWPRHIWRPKLGMAQGVLSVGYACAAAWLVNMRVMQEIGFFDARIFLYYEDEDLCLRVFAARKDILIIPEVRVTHAARGSVKGKHPYRAEYLRGYHHMQSKLYFNEKHFSQKPRKLRRILQTLLLIIARTVLLSPKHWSRALGRLRGIWDYQSPAYAENSITRVST